MGKTRRNIAHTGTVRRLHVVSHQRTAGKAIAELADACNEVSLLNSTVIAPSSRLLQQYHRHTVKFPTSWDDIPVAGLDEGEARIPASVMLWYVGISEPVSVAVPKLKKTLEDLRGLMVSCVELRFGECIAIVPLQTAEIEVEKVTPEVIGPRRLTRELGLCEQYHYQRPDPLQLLRDLMLYIAHKPSRIVIDKVILENGQVVVPRGNDCQVPVTVVGATVRVSVPGIRAYRGEYITGYVANCSTQIRVFVNDSGTVTLDRSALLAAGYGVNVREDLGHPITWQFWYKARHELYGVFYWDTQKLVVTESIMS